MEAIEERLPQIDSDSLSKEMMATVKMTSE